MSDNTEEFAARAYQIDLYEKAISNNLIIFLPTGAGKTFISVMLIKKLSGDLQKPYQEDGKRTIFIVNTVVLVVQQSQYIARHTGLSCKGYSGDMQVDLWNKQTWLAEIEQHQVMVMTAQIFLDILNHGYMSLEKVNLIIFDECHRAVSDHPMRQIMQCFKFCPPEKHPRILAMSATLLNSNVKLNKIENTIQSLETTFHAKIATVNSLNHVKCYATNPKESIVYYKPIVSCPIMERVNNTITEICHILSIVVIPQSSDGNDSSDVFKPRTKASKLQSVIKDVGEQFSKTGIYGGSKAVLLHLIQFEYMKKFGNNQQTLYVLEYVITKLTVLRKYLDDVMKPYSPKDQIYKFSCDEIHKLFIVLKNSYNSRYDDQRFACIIFVQRRFTAKVLYNVLKNLHDSDEEYKFLIPDYAIGYSCSPYNTPKEIMCMSNWNKEAISRFRNGVSNCLVATDVLDEGVDIPLCSLIIRYDAALDFRAYIQSKGRARHERSQYVLLIKENEKYLEQYKYFKSAEYQLKEILIGKTQNRNNPSEDEITKQLYNYQIEPYVITTRDGLTSTITEQNAICIINRYCHFLHKSKYVQLSPVWKLLNLNNSMYQVSLQLPTISLLKDIILGDPMPSILCAKKSAALKACISLHKIGELSDNLLPNDINTTLQNLNYLCPHWDHDETDENVGTYKKKRHHKLQYPTVLYGAFPEPNQILFLHVLHIVPTYPVPYDNRNLIFYNLLNDSAGFGILSIKQMPEVPSFPIFMNVGELNVNIVVNHKKIQLTKEQITDLKCFHAMIFNQVVPVIKRFMVFDNDNLENSFLVVPVDAEWNLNWPLINKYQVIENVAPSIPFQFSSIKYDLALVKPHYRGSVNVYIVTQICDEFTPASSFPTDDYYSYEHYYSERYKLKIQNKNQPMLEVKPISSKINCISPRSMKSNSSRRKRAEILEDFEEHLVPELCDRINFSALYWLKASTLPSILHRISQLLIAEDLRTTIVKEMGLGILCLPKGTKWPALTIQNKATEEQAEPLLELTCDDVIETSQAEPELSTQEIDVLNSHAHSYPWTKEQEPPNLDKNIEEMQLINIEYYYQFMAGTSAEDADVLRNKSKTITYMSKSRIPAPPLQVFKKKDSIGPDPVQIMQALTIRGRDVFDLERLETLGDAYLKFFISLCLYHTFPTYNEGRLTAIKGKIIGNRNLYYCGKNKNIPGRMKVDDFVPLSNFIAPAYTTPRMLQKLLLDIEVSSNVLYELSIPASERFTGYISESTKYEMQQTLSKWDATGSQTDMEHFLGIQTVADKTVADSVEALIGVYLTNMGLNAAARLLKWFGILPCSFEIADILFGMPANPIIGTGDPNVHMPWADAIEQKCDYKFRNRGFLLQAFTHPSYTANTITECYQRLEFLGDAILDFLITSYIYETCGLLSPGALTDLRSALVNNVTLACLAVRYGLHTALLAYAPDLSTIIDRFVKFQEEKGHEVTDELLWILLEEDECNYSEHVDVPKILGDLFESLIGAIYLDSGKDLMKIWEIIYAFMHKEIDLFSKNVPKHPIRVLYETYGTRITFLKAVVIEATNTVMVPLKINIAMEEKYFHGFGTNKKEAKRAAAKRALKCLR